MTKTKANCEFMDWWRQLNEEMNKLHRGQQVGLRDARGCYDMGETPEVAAKSLMRSWES